MMRRSRRCDSRASSIYLLCINISNGYNLIVTNILPASMFVLVNIYEVVDSKKKVRKGISE